MWSYLKSRRKSVLIVAMLCFLTGGLSYLGSVPVVSHHKAIITIESSKPIETQLFFDTGSGFNQNESVRKVVYQVNVPVTIQYDFSGYQIEDLRLDPSQSQARIKIHEMILQYHKKKPFVVPLDSIAAARDIKAIHHEGGILTLEVGETAKDPILLLKQIGPAPRSSKVRAIVQIIAKVLVVFGMVLFIIYCCSSQNIFKLMKHINITWLMNILYFFSCLLMFCIYAKGKWRDTISFMQSWMNW